MSEKNFTKIVQDFLIMMKFSCGTYRGYKRDKAEAENLTERKNAKPGTHRVNRQLFSDKTGPLYQANKHADAIRNWIYVWSFPWLDISGDSSKYRVVSLPIWMKKKQELNARVTRLKELWEEVFTQYESLVERDMRDQGDSADARDYLSLEELRSRFYVDVQITRVPASGSVVMDALNNEVDKLLANQAKHDQKIVENLMGNVWEKMLDPLKTLASKLSDPEYGFKDATIRDIAQMIETMRGFNITNDQKVESMLKEIQEKVLFGANPDALCNDPKALKDFANQFRPKKNKGDTTDRERIVAEAETIAQQMKSII